MENIKNSVQNIQMPSAEKIGEGLNNTLQSVGESISNTTQSISNSLKSFTSSSNVDAGSDYLNANGIVAKFAFVLFMVLVFILLYKLGIYLVIFFTKQSNNPYVVKGLVSSGNSQLQISQDPKKDAAVTIYRSNNQTSGLECTWSSWIYIDRLTNKSGGTPNYNHIYSKGNSKFDATTGIATVNNAPGVYLKDNNNELRICYDSFDKNATDPDTYIDISNIPIKKWVLLNIRIQNQILDVYLNGTIVARKIYNKLPKQNFDDVLIGYNSGFNGKLSNIRYYPYALSVFEMNNILMQGPNFVDLTQESQGMYTYLSNTWYNDKLKS